MHFPLFFDDLQEGQTFTSMGRTVTETDVVMFAGLSWDAHPVHTDEEYARQTPFGGRIAHGLLVAAMATGLLDRVGHVRGTALALLEITWKFRQPVRPGDTVRVRATVTGKRATKRPDRGIFTQQVEVLLQSGEVAQEGAMTFLIERSPAGHAT